MGPVNNADPLICWSIHTRFQSNGECQIFSCSFSFCVGSNA